MEIETQKSDAKMELVQVARDLMPAGKPAYLEVVKHPKITDMVTLHGSNTMLKVIFLMVKDFCSSINVVRNMNEDQMIEAASMLLDECDNFRLEDYVMMFSMAKRGDLVKIYDRVDISVVTAMMDEYWQRRRDAGKKAMEEPVSRLDSLGNTTTKIDTMSRDDVKMIRSADNLAAAIGDMKAKFSTK